MYPYKRVVQIGYPADLNDQQRSFVKAIFERMVGNYGNRSKWDKRDLMNAVRYLNGVCCQKIFRHIHAYRSLVYSRFI